MQVTPELFLRRFGVILGHKRTILSHGRGRFVLAPLDVEHPCIIIVILPIPRFATEPVSTRFMAIQPLALQVAIVSASCKAVAGWSGVAQSLACVLGLHAISRISYWREQVCTHLWTCARSLVKHHLGWMYTSPHELSRWVRVFAMVMRPMPELACFCRQAHCFPLLGFTIRPPPGFRRSSVGSEQN